MPGSAASLNTCLGKYRGGPGGGHVRVTYDAKAGGVVKGEYHGKSGGAAGFEGKMVDKGKKVLGFWYDYDQKITPGNRFECTCVITLEGAHGEVLKAKLRTKDGGSDEWEAKRWSEQDVPRTEGKIAGFCVKDAKTFERVTDDGKAHKEAWVQGARAKALEASVQRANFDGALTYIPGPATGAEYMTAHDLERAARVKEAGHRDERIAALEANVARLAARAAKGEDVKAQLDKAQQLHKGEVREKKMLEERADKKWVSGAGTFTPASSRHAEHMPDVYATELEIMRRLRKEDLERPEKDKARMAAELPRLQAAISKGEGNVEVLKRREEFLKRMLAAKIPSKDDFKEFKPTSRVVALASSTPAEHMPSPYFSAIELERKLREERKEKDAKELEAKAAEVEKLAKKKAAGGALDEKEARRLEAFAKIVKGERAAAAAVASGDRKGFKSGAGSASGPRLSSSVMFNQVNMRRAMGSMGLH